MATNTAATASFCRNNWDLLNTHAVAGIQKNCTTATASTRKGEKIEVSFCAQRPLCPSVVFVHSSDMSHVPPQIICAVKNFLILRVSIDCRQSPLSSLSCDFFIYRVHTSRPWFERLKRPHPYFKDCQVGLLPRADDQYTVAMLTATHNQDQYNLHLFHSDVSSWSCRTLCVEAPQRAFPVKIPVNSGRLNYHLTTTVITIGGEGGTMGWVDLWRGILFCNVLDENPSIRGVPLPVPLNELSYDNGMGLELGAPQQRRGIAFISEKGCLKFVHLEIVDIRLPGYNEETGRPMFKTHKWVLTTFRNTKMTDSFDDWHEEYKVRSSDLKINPTITQQLYEGLFSSPQDNDTAAEQLALLSVSLAQPTPCVNDKNVVHLVAWKKYLHRHAWILTVNMEKGELQDVFEFGARKYRGTCVIYLPSKISTFCNLPEYAKPATMSAPRHSYRLGRHVHVRAPGSEPLTSCFRIDFTDAFQPPELGCAAAVVPGELEL